MATPPPGTELIVRPSGRIFVVDDDHRALMIRGEDPQNPKRGGFWWTPGGGIDAGESAAEGATRELWEEVGLRLGSPADLGPVVMTRRSVFSMDAIWYDSFETFYLVRVDSGFVPRPQAWEAIELAAITELRFLGSDEIREMAEPVYPLNLPDFLDQLQHNGPPTEPWFEEGRDDRPENNPEPG